jgi:hypothetical protein
MIKVNDVLPKVLHIKQVKIMMLLSVGLLYFYMQKAFEMGFVEEPWGRTNKL